MSWEVFCTTFANNNPKLNLDKTISENRWAVPSMIRQKHTTRPSRLIGSTVRENKPRELVEILVDQDIEKTDNGQSGGIVDQVFFALIAKRMVTMFPTVSRSRGKIRVGDSSEIRDDPTRNILQKATKAMGRCAKP